MTRDREDAIEPAAVRLGAVSYLNTVPLLPGLRAAGFQIVEAVPARCWELLAGGEVELGIIPVIGLAERQELEVVPGVAIASDGPVRSVLLITRCAPESMRSVAVDASSRTSVVLLRILCRERYAVEPEFVTVAPDWRRMLAQHDGALLIGDAALDLTAGVSAGTMTLPEEVRIIDLGAEWSALTGLPFVYAVWAGLAAHVTSAVVEALNRSRDRGLAELEVIAGRSAPDEVRRAYNLDYLRDAIRYRLGPRELEGMGRYLDLAAAHGLAPALGPARRERWLASVEEVLDVRPH